MNRERHNQLSVWDVASDLERTNLNFNPGLEDCKIEALGLSVATVKNYWTFARTWIFNEIRSS